VYHGFIQQVYRFFGFGADFISLLSTIGTGRTAKIIFDSGKTSPSIYLERGFMQGDGPSPRLYNIGEQILLFRLEYDPAISGVYLTFLIPRVVDNGEVHHPQIGSAEDSGLVIEPELKHHNRRVPAFADDSNGAFKRSRENLELVKNVLLDFGVISGLETNVEKTTLMPIGLLDEPLPQDILDLGFEIVSEIKCLGLVINNRASNLENHFNGTARKIGQLIGSWERYNLSLTGKISIAKTMLISQIGYIGCIITPTANQIATMQDLIDGYVRKGIVIASERLYTKPNLGGLGLIKLDKYIAALQCSWIKRCSIVINDPWRWILSAACNFNFDNINTAMILKRDHPIVWNIFESMNKFEKSLFLINENFLEARLVDNPMFLRAPPERRAPVRGVVDRNLLGHGFYDTNKERLLKLKMNCLISNGRVKSFNKLCTATGLRFPQAVYLNLVTAGNFALKKYANRIGSNGTTVSVMEFLGLVKRGSKKFRRVLEKTEKIRNWKTLEL
jgi:hypothetical protein